MNTYLQKIEYLDFPEYFNNFDSFLITDLKNIILQYLDLKNIDLQDFKLEYNPELFNFISKNNNNEYINVNLIEFSFFEEYIEYKQFFPNIIKVYPFHKYSEYRGYGGRKKYDFICKLKDNTYMLITKFCYADNYDENSNCILDLISITQINIYDSLYDILQSEFFEDYVQYILNDYFE